MFVSACSCAEVDLEKGLLEVVKLTMDGWNHLQKLDYEQIHFKYKACHEHRIFSRNCPSPPPYQAIKNRENVSLGKKRGENYGENIQKALLSPTDPLVMASSIPPSSNQFQVLSLEGDEAMWEEFLARNEQDMV